MESIKYDQLYHQTKKTGKYETARPLDGDTFLYNERTTIESFIET